MFIASQDFVTKQSGFSRTFHAKLVVGSTEITEGILSLKCEGCVNEEDTLTLGSTVSNRVEISIMNLSIPIEGKEFTAYVGLDINGTVEYIPLGIFTAQKPEKDDSLYTFTAFDRMMKTEKAYFSSLPENTTTVAVLKEICSKLGFTLATTLKAISIKKIEGLTYREAISYIAQLHGGYATFNRQGQLEIRYFKDVSYTVKVDRYFDDLVVQENNFIVNAISCATNEENTLTAGTGVASIAISNPYMTQSTLNSIYNTLKGFTYRPASFSMLGDILLDPGDIITMQAKDGNVYKIPIMSITQEFDGGLTTTIEAVGKTEEELDLDYKGPSTKTMERYVIELALINKVVANKVDAEYVEAEFIKVNNTISAVTGEFQTIKGNVAEFEKTVTTKLEAISGKIDDLEVVDLTAIKADITTLNAKVANIDHVLAGNITAENIQTGAITAGSGIIAEGAIGDAQISSLSANKIRAGRIDTSLVTVASSDSVINITGNQVLINDTTNVLQPINRVTLGKYRVNENNWEYGLLVRSADGQTVMIDGNGVHNAGITNGAVDNNKVASDANIDGTKLNINSVVTQINKGTTKIQSTVVNIGNKTLEVYLAEQTQTISGHTNTLSDHSSKISANEKAISLKVDSQTYSSDKADMTSKLNKTTSDLSIIQGQISSKVWQSDITTATNALKNTEIKTLNDKYTTLDQTVNGIKGTVAQHTTEIAKKADGSTVSSLQSTITNLTVDLSGFKTSVSETYTTKTEFNNLAIGGRNLILNSAFNGSTHWVGEGILIDTSKKYDNCNSLKGTSKISVCSSSTPAKIGDVFTVSAKTFIGTSGGSLPLITFEEYKDDTTNRITYQESTVSPAINSWQTYKATWTVKNSETTNVRIRIYHKEEAYNFWVSQPKLEKGNKATDWSPAPEDIDSAIETVSTTQTQLSNKFSWIVKSGTSSSNFQITDRMATLTAQYINLNGLVTFSGLTSDVQNKVNTAVLVNNTVNNNKANWDKGLTAYNWTSANGTKATNLYEMVTQWTNGAVSGTTEINGGWVKTGTLTADKIAIGDFTNYAQLNENTLSKYGWTKVADSSASNNPWFQKSTIGRDSQISEWHTCNGGESFRIKANIYTTVKGASTSGGTDSSFRGIGIGVFSVNKDGTRNYQTSSRITNSTNGEISSVITLPSNAREFAVYIQIDGWNPFTGILRVRNVQVLRMSSGEMIVDGSITANMIKGKLLEGVTLKACNADITGGSINIVSGNESSSLIKLTDGQYATTKFNAWGMDVASGIYNTTTQVQSGGLFGRYNGTMMFGISSSTGYITCKNIDLPNVAITNASIELKSGRGTDVKLQSDWGLRFESSNWNSRMITWTNSTQGHDIQMGSDYVGGFRRWFVRDVTSNTICMSWDSDDNQLNVYPQIEAQGGLLNGSTEKLKTNIEKANVNALDIINKSELYTYNLKSLFNQGITKKQYGFIIERECPDEIVSHNRQAVDTYSMAAIAWSGIKQLHECIKDLEKTVADQQQTIGNLLANRNVVI